MGTPEHFLRDLAIVLVTAGATTLLFQRLRWPVVAGYLVAGVLVGPSFTPTWLSDEHSIHLLSELGVILLMFSIGLDFRLGRLARAGPAAGLAALVEIGLMLALGFGAGRALGWPTLASLFFAGAVSVSSTMILAKALEERPVERELRERLFSLTLFEDLAAMVIIALLTAAASGEGLSGSALATVIGRLLGLLAVALVVGLALVPRVARWVIGLRNPETMLVSMIGFAFGISWLAGAAGFSVALGAFVAGLLVAESGEGRVVEESVRPMRDVFSAIFFVATGMQLDVRVLAGEWPLALGLATVVLLGKPVAVAIGMYRHVEGMGLVDDGLIEQVGAGALERQQVGRRIVGETDLHRVKQRKGDEDQHAGHAGKQVAPGQGVRAAVDRQGRHAEDEQCHRHQRLPGGVQAEHQPQQPERTQPDDGACQPGRLRRCRHRDTTRAAAPSSASFGDCRPCEIASSAASIAGKTRPISGMLGIGSPASALAIVARMFGSVDSAW